MSGLIPEVRTDKNGRQVIRHVKPDSATKGSSLGAIRPPQLKTMSRSDRVGSLLRSISMFDGAAAVSGSNNLSMADDETLTLIEDMSFNPEYGQDISFRKALRSAVANGEKFERRVQSMSVAVGHVSHGHLIRFADSLEYMPVVKEYENLAKAPEHIKAAVRGMAVIVNQNFTSASTLRQIVSDENLVEALIEKPEFAYEYAVFYKERDGATGGLKGATENWNMNSGAL